ncbi:hypothetical protein [Sulfitobacter sp. 20_GPM-1509m]|uniref:hypothetical protein n=1 Tax=Sulfitobacter sp. 20_GPM-1509m TaxID=1380367 RepID=UPI00048AEC3E|nr:hypothetical protein [Sulfitobacter sp. 20_GPM-1509m]
MSESQMPDYRTLLIRSGVTLLTEQDLADLTPGLRAIDGKIEVLRKLAASDAGTFPDPLDEAVRSDG